MVFSFVLVFSCLVLTMFTKAEHDSRVDDGAVFVEASVEGVLIVLERIIMIQFTLEYILRLWSAGCRSRYQGLIGRLHFARRPFCVIDLIGMLSNFYFK